MRVAVQGDPVNKSNHDAVEIHALIEKEPFKQNSRFQLTTLHAVTSAGPLRHASHFILPTLEDSVYVYVFVHMLSHICCRRAFAYASLCI